MFGKEHNATSIPYPGEWLCGPAGSHSPASHSSFTKVAKLLEWIALGIDAIPKGLFKTKKMIIFKTKYPKVDPWVLGFKASFCRNVNDQVDPQYPTNKLHSRTSIDKDLVTRNLILLRAPLGTSLAFSGKSLNLDMLIDNEFKSHSQLSPIKASLTRFQETGVTGACHKINLMVVNLILYLSNVAVKNRLNYRQR